jgi:hypothetical protein
MLGRKRSATHLGESETNPSLDLRKHKDGITQPPEIDADTGSNNECVLCDHNGDEGRHSV